MKDNELPEVIMLKKRTGGISLLASPEIKQSYEEYMNILIDQYNEHWVKIGRELGWKEYCHKNYDGSTENKPIKDLNNER
jgi:hypothetical protein